MSYDVFFQGFIAGEQSSGGGVRMREVLSPYAIAEEGASLRVRIGDGEADLILSEDGMLASHVSGRDPWQLLYLGAKAANWVVLLLDGPTCLTAPGQREDLPDGLSDDAVLVESGEDLLKAINGG